MTGMTGLGFSADYPEQPQGPSGPPAQPVQGVPDHTHEEPDAGKSMLTPLGDVQGQLDEMLGRTPLQRPEPLDPQSRAPVQMTAPQPAATPPAMTELAQRMNQPRGWTAPRTTGIGISTQQRMQASLSTGGYRGPSAPSMNGIASSQVMRQWGNPTAAPQVGGSSTLGVSQGDLVRRQGMTVSAPSPSTRA